VLFVLNKVAAACLAWIARVLLCNQVAYLRRRLEVAVENNRGFLRGEISDSLITALVVGEDRRFWSHNGIDLAAICRAIYHIAALQQLEGASTVEQQLVRTLTGYRKLSVRRKLREMVLASEIGNMISKREIAILYLCCAYYGWRMNSLAEASSRMGFKVGHMSLRQSAELIARLKYPEQHVASRERHTLIANRALYILRRGNKNSSA
jgi:membrane carboxypeptidase/penicillin-binding protein